MCSVSFPLSYPLSFFLLCLCRVSPLSCGCGNIQTLGDQTQLSVTKVSSKLTDVKCCGTTLVKFNAVISQISKLLSHDLLITFTLTLSPPLGSALLILTASDTSSTSYYGEQGLHFMDTKGTGCLVTRSM